jgi:hypothetical protein
MKGDAFKYSSFGIKVRRDDEKEGNTKKTGNKDEEDEIKKTKRIKREKRRIIQNNYHSTKVYRE